MDDGDRAVAVPVSPTYGVGSETAAQEAASGTGDSMSIMGQWEARSLKAAGAFRRALGERLGRDRFARYQEALAFFRDGFPELAAPDNWRLIDMAVSYWDYPDRWE